MGENIDVAIRIGQLADLGTALLPDLFVDHNMAAGRLEELFADDLNARVGIYLLYPSAKKITAATRAFVDFMAGNMSLGKGIA